MFKGSTQRICFEYRPKGGLTLLGTGFSEIHAAAKVQAAHYRKRIRDRKEKRMVDAC